jgi:hypothetical protein
MNYIDGGRKGLAIDGSEHEGRILYEDGLSEAMAAFTEVAATADAETLILAEHVFLTKELQFCDQADAAAIASITQAIASFDYALRSLEAVADFSSYRVAEKTYPLFAKYRIHGMPKDAFHTACIAHRTRLNNILRAPGINMTEKALYQQRAANISTAQSVYGEIQKKCLES